MARRGGRDDPEILWRVEKQVDSANQHLLKALSILRKELHHTKIKHRRLIK